MNWKWLSSSAYYSNAFSHFQEESRECFWSPHGAHLLLTNSPHFWAVVRRHKDRKGFPENKSIQYSQRPSSTAADWIRVQVHPPRADYMEIRFNHAVQTNRNEENGNFKQISESENECRAVHPARVCLKNQKSLNSNYIYYVSSIWFWWCAILFVRSLASLIPLPPLTLYIPQHTVWIAALAIARTTSKGNDLFWIFMWNTQLKRSLGSISNGFAFSTWRAVEWE